MILPINQMNSSQGLEPTKNRIPVPVLLGDLKTCSKTRNLERGKHVHAEAVECNHDSNVTVASALINMYAKCSSMVDARQVFDLMQHPDVVAWSALILGYADNGQGYTALDLLTKMKNGGPAPNSATLVAALKACTSLILTEGANGQIKCRDRGKIIHDLTVENGWDSDIYVQNTLIYMYGKCGSMISARLVFDSMKYPNVVSWSVLILGYAENGEGHIALCLFGRMRSEGPAYNTVTLVAALKACTSLALGTNGREECRRRGKEIHDLAVENGCDSNIYVQNTLIDMYCKCGSMMLARHVFESMKQPNVVTWTALIQGYADNGQGLVALDLFTRMKTSGPAPNMVTSMAAVKACTSLALNEETNGREECSTRGKKVHNLAVENGCDSDIYMQNSLIDMYAKCDNMVVARQVFNSAKHPNVVSWTTLILGYADNGQGLTALDVFTRMRSEGPAPNSVTLVAALKACALLGALECGRNIHLEIDRDNHHNMIVVTSLVDFYAKCGSLLEAQSVFNLHSQSRDIVTWTALLAGFSSCGDHESVFGLFQGMQDAGFKPNSVSFLSILTCCSHAGLVEKGKECFETMSTMYGIIPNVEHYTCIADIFGRANKIDDAMALFERMPCTADYVAWMTILAACRTWKNVEVGRLAFQSLIDLNDRDAAAYVTMGQIYGSRGMLQEQEMVMGMRKLFF